MFCERGRLEKCREFRNFFVKCKVQVHLCGEEAAIDIVKKLLDPIGETVQVWFLP